MRTSLVFAPLPSVSSFVLPSSGARAVCAVALAAAAFAVPLDAAATTLQAGPGKTYATPCQAIAAAQDGDEVDVDAGKYPGDTCKINQSNLIVRAVGGGRAVLDATGVAIAGSKGILLVEGENVTLEGLELTGAAIDASLGENGAGVRMEGHGLVVRDCFFHDNQNGILASPIGGGGNLLIEYSEFSHNGLGNGCNSSGCTHNLYINAVDKLTFQFNWSHDVQTAHLLKSRARSNFILYNRIGSEGNTSSSIEINLPNGGQSYVIGNIIQKDAQAGNGNLLTFGDDQLGPNGNDLYVVANTFVNAKAGGTFILLHKDPSKLVVRDNVFAGDGTIVSPSATISGDNWVGADPGFAAPGSYDYHLTAGSPAAGIGVDPGSAPDMSLVPVFEYVHPLSKKARATAKDAGAFELGGGAGGAGAGGAGAGGAIGTAGTTSAGGTASAGTTGTGGSGTAGNGTAGTTSAGGSSAAGKGGSGGSGGTGGSGVAGAGTGAGGKSAGGAAGAGAAAGTASAGKGGSAGATSAGKGGAAGVAGAASAGKGGSGASAGKGGSSASAGKGGASGGAVGATGGSAPAANPAAPGDAGSSGGCAITREPTSGGGVLLVLAAALSAFRRRRDR